MDSAPSVNIGMEEKCTVWSTSATSISVAWDRQFAQEIAAPNTINSYVIKFRVEGEPPPFGYKPIKKEEDNAVEIKDLKSNTLYEINVYWCNTEEESVTLFKKKCKTDESKVTFLMETASADKTGKPIIYHLKPVSIIEHQMQDENNYDTGYNADTIRVLDMIAERKANIYSSDEKTLLLLGGTGTGKSTMIDALMNYIAEISYTDDYRFGLICKTKHEKEREDKQFQSQTSSVTIYRIPRMKGLKVSCGVNIIDTPGFNDTRECFDKRITAQIRELFEKRIDHLDAILIVLPLSTKRLTEGQKHIFSSILEMFGDDIKDNIFVTFTHDDTGGEQSCLSLLNASGVPYKGYFRFNNANIFSKSQSSEENVNIEFWKTRTDNFSKLFQNLETTKKTTITSSIAVMRARTRLEIQLQALEDVLSQQAQYIANYKEDKIVIHEIENESPEYRKRNIYRRTIPETEEQYTYRESLNCPKCRKTCHYRCLVPIKKLEWACEVMTDDKCTVCDGKCDAKDHVLTRKIYRVVYVTKLYSGDDVVSRHEKRKETFNQLKNTIHRIENCITEINSTALTKNSLTVTQYIQNLVSKEMEKKSEGFTMRIQIQNNIMKHLEKNKTSNLSMDYLIED